MALADAETGSKLGDQAIFVSDIVDRANVPDAKMTVGFARVGNREALDISFPYDSVVASVSQVERQTTEMDEIGFACVVITTSFVSRFAFSRR